MYRNPTAISVGVILLLTLLLKIIAAPEPEPGAIKDAAPAGGNPLAEKVKEGNEVALGQDSKGVNDKVNEDFKPPANPGQLADPFGRGGIHGGGARASDVEASRAIRVTGIGTNSEGLTQALLAYAASKRTLLISKGDEVPLAMKGTGSNAEVKEIGTHTVTLVLPGGAELILR